MNKLGATNFSKIRETCAGEARRIHEVWEHYDNHKYRDAIRDIVRGLERAFPPKIDMTKITATKQTPGTTDTFPQPCGGGSSEMREVWGSERPKRGQRRVTKAEMTTFCREFSSTEPERRELKGTEEQKLQMCEAVRERNAERQEPRRGFQEGTEAVH